MRLDLYVSVFILLSRRLPAKFFFVRSFPSRRARTRRHLSMITDMPTVDDEDDGGGGGCRRGRERARPGRVRTDRAGPSAGRR